ncbi:MAG: response regulator [Ignavibacteriaceae bacterium]|nr:response regulator [Ignavibacteriaceae bacterium]
MYKFLVVEDDDTIQIVVNRLLTKNFECQVKAAKNGLEALQYLEKELPDLILMDVSMPVMDGIETLTAIRADERLADLPVIILTAMNDKASVSSLVTKGISDYILKPINFSYAPSRIKHVLNQARLSKSERLHQKFNGEKEKETVLVIDKEQSFRNFVYTLLTEEFNVFEAPNCVDGLTIYVDKKPNYILVTEKQEVLNEKILAQKVKNNPEKNFKGIFLLKEETIKDSTAHTYFNGVLKRNFVKEDFLSQFYKTVIGKLESYIIVKEMITGSISSAVGELVLLIANEHLIEKAEVSENHDTDSSDFKVIWNKLLVDVDSKTNIHFRLLSEKEVSTADTLSEGKKTLEVLNQLSEEFSSKFITMFRNYEINLTNSEAKSADELKLSTQSFKHSLSIVFNNNHKFILCFTCGKSY